MVPTDYRYGSPGLSSVFPVAFRESRLVSLRRQTPAENCPQVSSQFRVTEYVPFLPPACGLRFPTTLEYLPTPRISLRSVARRIEGLEL